MLIFFYFLYFYFLNAKFENLQLLNLQAQEEMASEMKEGEEDLDGLLLFMQRARRRLRGDVDSIHKSHLAFESAAYGPPAVRE